VNDYGSAIKAWRNAWGKKQSDVASAIGVSEAYISQIESGKRKLKLDIALKIAHYYGVSVERLIQREYFPPSTSSSPTTFTLTDAQQMLKECFPVVITDEAMQNKDFKMAYGLQKLFVREQLTPEGPQISIISYCIERYYSAWKEAGILEAAANLLGLMIMFGASITDMDEEKAQKAQSNLIRMKAFDLGILGNYYLKTPNNTIDNSAQKKEFVDNSWELIVEFIAALKKSESRKSLGDYYLALCYFFGIIKGNLTAEEYKMMGLDFLTTFAILGNEYAIRFLTG